MLQALYDFFFNLFSHNTGTLDDFMNAQVYEVDGLGIVAMEYFSIICSLISLIFIVILCCLFVYKIIKLIGGLIR